MGVSTNKNMRRPSMRNLDGDDETMQALEPEVQMTELIEAGASARVFQGIIRSTGEVRYKCMKMLQIDTELNSCMRIALCREGRQVGPNRADGRYSDTPKRN